MSLAVARCPSCRFTVPVFTRGVRTRFVPHSREGRDCGGSFERVAGRAIHSVAGSASYADLRLNEGVAVPFLQEEREVSA